MNWTTQLLRTIKAGTFLFSHHSLSSFPLSTFLFDVYTFYLSAEVSLVQQTDDTVYWELEVAELAERKVSMN